MNVRWTLTLCFIPKFQNDLCVEEPAWYLGYQSNLSCDIKNMPRRTGEGEGGRRPDGTLTASCEILASSAAPASLLTASSAMLGESSGQSREDHWVLCCVSLPERDHGDPSPRRRQHGHGAVQRGRAGLHQRVPGQGERQSALGLQAAGGEGQGPPLPAPQGLGVSRIVTRITYKYISVFFYVWKDSHSIGAVFKERGPV